MNSLHFKSPNESSENSQSAEVIYLASDQNVRKKKRSGAWITSYADVITQLLVFFVIIVSASKVSAIKMEQIQKSVQPVLEEIPKQDSMQKILASLNDVITRNGLSDSVAVSSNQDGIMMVIKDGLLFESGDSMVTDTSQKQFQILLASLKELPEIFHFAIEGHTDDVPMAGGKFSSNWELSSMRAITILNLFKIYGFSENRLSVHGYADQRPLAPNRDGAGNPIFENMQKNRRVVIRVK